MHMESIDTAMGKLTYKLMASDADLRKAFDVRRQVFVREQGISEGLVFDNHDRDALHVVVEDGEKIIGTARVRFLGNKQAKLERMAVTKAFRHKGIGRGIIALLDAELRAKQVQQVVIHAQEGAVEFYKSCGFKESGSPFREANIKHIKMLRMLRRL
jgi:predicted GNAT family N-acyltransferase